MSVLSTKDIGPHGWPTSVFSSVTLEMFRTHLALSFPHHLGCASLTQKSQFTPVLTLLLILGLSPAWGSSLSFCSQAVLNVSDSPAACQALESPGLFPVAENFLPQEIRLVWRAK